jgi:hypothetical protein
VIAGVALSAAPAAAAETCPNEALRAENNSLALGGCRAFERVTPSFQNGFGAAEILALAPGGEELIVTSASGFAGAEGSFIGPYYKLTRTSSGWQTASISPPATKFPARAFYAASADLGRSLWALRSPTESIYAQNLYLRERDGSLAEIGPMVPPSSETGPQAGGFGYFLGDYQFRGASADLSHVYFSIVNGLGQSVLWPGDTTTVYGNRPLAFSLYEYSGTGNTRPSLVGVNTEGRLISDCATFLGSDENHEEYNAVSADGDKAFFTADGHDQEACPETVINNGVVEPVRAPEVTEVYARLDSQETVAISEPIPQDCTECRPGPFNPGTQRKGAQFQGASADGEKVFFTTEQELLPGAETNNLFEFDFGSARGRRVRQLSIGIAAPKVLGVARISEDGSHVYFVAEGRLTDVPRGGGCIAEETAAEQIEEELTHEGRCRPRQGQPNLYVYVRDAEHPLGQVRFLATLSEADQSDWSPKDARPVQATPTGSRLAFESTAPLTSGVSGPGPQVFEYDVQTEELVRISRGQNGYPQGTANANASFSFIEGQNYLESMPPASRTTFLAISDDGSHVQFSSPAALTPANEEAAAAGAISVYEYRSAGPISGGNVFPLSAGLTKAGIEGISPDGRNSFFRSEDPLVAGQTDLQRNVFDAREDGGFPSAAHPAGCLGEGCLEAAPQSPPRPPAPGTLTATAGDSPATAAPSGSAEARQKALAKCRRKQKPAARKRCERQVRKRFKRPRHLASVKDG